jgi:hypothetical protein
LHFGVLFFSLLVLVLSQGQEINQESIDESLKRLQQGQAYPADLYRLAQAGAKQAIPAMKEQFAASKDNLLKQAIASALVRLVKETRPIGIFGWRMQELPWKTMRPPYSYSIHEAKLCAARASIRPKSWIGRRPATLTPTPPRRLESMSFPAM